MQAAIDETARRRAIQQEYNEANGITPKTIEKAVRDLISISKKVEADDIKWKKDPESMSKKELLALIAQTESEMKKAALDLDFERAAMLRDQLFELKAEL